MSKFDTEELERAGYSGDIGYLRANRVEIIDTSSEDQLLVVLDTVSASEDTFYHYMLSLIHDTHGKLGRSTLSRLFRSVCNDVYYYQDYNKYLLVCRVLLDRQDIGWLYEDRTRLNPVTDQSLYSMYDEVIDELENRGD